MAPLLRSVVAAGPTETAVLVAILGTLYMLYVALTKATKHDLDKVPGPWKKAWPLVGNAPSLLKPDFHRQFLAWNDEFGGICRIKFFWTDVLLVTDPVALGSIMGRGEGAIDKAFETYAPINKMTDPHGNPNLLTAPADEKWKAIRKGVAVSFAFQNIKKKYPMILQRVNRVIQRAGALGPSASIDVDQLALRVTLDVIGLAGFGHDYQSVEKDVPEYDHLLRVLPRCFTEVMLRVINPLRPKFPHWFQTGPKGAAAFKEFQDQMRFLLNKIRQDGRPAEDDSDIGAQVWRVMDEHPDISEDRMLSEIGMLFVEGFETTGHTTSWTLFNIATCPHAQDKIEAELDSLGLLHKEGAAPRELDLDDLKRMPYLAACAKEGMRMFPVVSIMGRMATKVTKVGPYTVPSGTVVGTPLFAIQNTVHNWDEPHTYRPERWVDVPIETWVYNSKEGESGGKRGITFMPFSEGPRNCVGQSLAKMEVMTLLAKLLASFRIELAPEMGGREGIRKRESTAMTLQTTGTKGIRCYLHPRSELVGKL
ncbi:putative cytochrome P450 [Monoraphidium neglectum]|uniref:Putative cytochrome P450 n=1 Tax=Monoraphidium neglectum TaxID=145388 RepID=A0A0D2MN50_9CHLO|nr:putative cytochrome P450 [Monoraphidium neglectum]KIZ01997.1 putative cytochrome P450 [Monoraphidium neglectum]|eukprot:XP_013901016.1 putative cytochrome P450 [Monoraphidium neglectum]